MKFSLVLLGLFSVVLGVHADAEKGRLSTSPMNEFAASGRVPSADAWSELNRQGHFGATVEIVTDGLDPGTPYTVWAVIFNAPEHCASIPCGGPDLPVSPNANPRVEASAMYVTGATTDADGRAHFFGRIPRTVGGVSTNERLFGQGLLQPMGAEIHFLLKGHGPNPGNRAIAVGSYDGGCTDDNPCGEHQSTVHLP